jgi:hypothetical protein
LRHLALPQQRIFLRCFPCFFLQRSPGLMHISAWTWAEPGSGKARAATNTAPSALAPRRVAGTPR